MIEILNSINSFIGLQKTKDCKLDRDYVILSKDYDFICYRWFFKKVQ